MASVDLPSGQFEFMGEPPRRFPRWLAVGALGLVLAGLVVALAAMRMAQATAEVVSQQSLAAQEQSEAGRDLILSTLAYASPMIWSSSVSEDVRGGLRQLVQDTAAGVVADLSVPRESLATARIWPWQGDLGRRRDEALAAIDENLMRFRAVAADARALTSVFADPLAVVSATPRESGSQHQ